MVRYSEPAPRRTFLRGLVALPFIGGGLALVGSPTAAAVPTSDALLRRYAAFTGREHEAACLELLIRQATSSDEIRYHIERQKVASVGWRVSDPVVKAIVFDEEPSERAAVILSAAGVPLI